MYLGSHLKQKKWRSMLILLFKLEIKRRQLKNLQEIPCIILQHLSQITIYSPFNIPPQGR
jgi:hypothetical protein